MKRLETILWSYEQCRKEAREFDDLLKTHSELDERDTVLPFFRARRHLSAFCGGYNPFLTIPNRIAYEFELYGDFQCDLVVGNWASRFCFVEFEDAKEKSVFEKRGKKATLEWASRFEHGYSQIIDWFYKLADMSNTNQCEALFGKREVDYEGLLVIGRDEHLGLAERARLTWRRHHTVLNSRKIHCVTFDELFRDIQERLDNLGIVLGAAGASSSS